MCNCGFEWKRRVRWERFDGESVFLEPYSSRVSDIDRARQKEMEIERYFMAEKKGEQKKIELSERFKEERA